MPQSPVRVRALSGEELLTAYFEPSTTIKQLKQALQESLRLPRFRQRLLVGGQVLEDHHALGQAVELQLVKLDYVRATETQVVELLYDAADGRLQAVENALQQPLDPNDCMRASVGENTLMHISPIACAARYNSTEVMQLLLSAHADVNLPGSDMALWLASCAGHPEAVEVLLIARAEVDSCQESTALFVAALNDHRSVVQVLLDSDADVHKPNSVDTWTPLHAACLRGHYEVVELLLDYRADAFSSKESDDDNPIQLAFLHGHIGIVRLLMQSSLQGAPEPRTALASAGNETGMPNPQFCTLEAAEMADGNNQCVAPRRIAARPKWSATQRRHVITQAH